jgi:hypothetical protein
VRSSPWIYRFCDAQISILNSRAYVVCVLPEQICYNKKVCCLACCDQLRFDDLEMSKIDSVMCKRIRPQRLPRHQVVRRPWCRPRGLQVCPRRLRARTSVLPRRRHLSRIRCSGAPTFHSISRGWIESRFLEQCHAGEAFRDGTRTNLGGGRVNEGFPAKQSLFRK